MKLLVVTNDFPPRVGGIEDYVAQLLNHLPAGMSALVVGPPHPDAASFDARFRHRVVRWPTYPMLPTPGLTRRVKELVAEERPDVLIFGAALPLALMSRALHRTTHIPIVAFTHGVEPALAGVPLGPSVLRAVARHVSALTVVSGWAEARVGAAVGSLTRVERLPSGIDGGRFHPAADGRHVRARHRLEPGPVIVCLSRLVRRKGQDRLMRAIADLRPSWPTVRLLIAGDGPDRSRLSRLARRLRLDGHVVFAGPVAEADVPHYIAAGEVFAMPCRSRLLGLDTEALGAVFLQAAACGRPAIAGRSGGAPEAVLDGETGLVVNPHDIPAIARAIDRLLRSPDERRALGRQAALRAHADYSWTDLAARLARLLGEVIGTVGHRSPTLTLVNDTSKVDRSTAWK